MKISSCFGSSKAGCGTSMFRPEVCPKRLALRGDVLSEASDLHPAEQTKRQSNSGGSRFGTGIRDRDWDRSLRGVLLRRRLCFDRRCGGEHCLLAHLHVAMLHLLLRSSCCCRDGLGSCCTKRRSILFSNRLMYVLTTYQDASTARYLKSHSDLAFLALTIVARTSPDGAQGANRAAEGLCFRSLVAFVP